MDNAITQQPARAFPLVRVDTNNGTVLLKDATWTPYDLTCRYNPNGDNGFLSGTVVSGYVINRLFHVTHRVDEVPGKPMRVDYAALTKLRVNGREQPTFELYSCG
jgi:hypothetical protein